MSMEFSKTTFFAMLTAAFVAGIGLTYTLMPIGEGAAREAVGEKTPLYWVAPMDPNYRRDKPGKSPMGMDLVPVYEEAETNQAPGTVSISPRVANNLGVERGEAIVEDLSLRVPTVGFIQFDEETISHVHSRVDGWIESLAVTAVGDAVIEGQQLFELYSPELVNAQEEFVAALAANNKRLLSAAKRKLQALGVDNSLIDELQKNRRVKQRLPFYSPRGGYISTLNVREGMFIRPAIELLAVGSLQRVWVIAEIFERQAAWVKPGQRVRMTIDSYPGEEWVGVVDYLYPVLDAQTRTLRARIVFDNADERLKPNMFAQLEIEAGTKQQVVSIPRKAVIYQAGISRVVKVVGDNQYRSVRVYTGIESGERIEISAGLEVGDEVVISSQFMIDSESSVSAELSRIEGSPAAEQAVATVVCTQGQVVSLMADHRMARITHEPIPEWSWPEMTMDFFFADGVELDGFTDGQTVEVCLEKQSDGSYLVTDMRKPEMQDHSMHPSHSMETQPAFGQEANAVDHSQHQH